MKRATTIFLAAFAAANALALGAKETPKEEAPVTLKFAGLKGPSGIGIVRMLETPPALPNGSKAEFTLLASADLVVAKVMTGEADIAVLPSSTAVKLYNAGLPYVLGAVSGDGMLTLVTDDPSVASTKDLAGKDIQASGQGSVPEYVTRWLFARHGLDPENGARLSFNMAYPEMAQSLIAGRIKYAILPEPFSTMAVKGNPALRKAADLQTEYSAFSGEANYPITAVIVKRSLAESSPAAVRALFSAYRESIDWVVANPKAAGELAEKHEIGLKAAIAAASIPGSAFTFRPAAEAKASFSKILAVLLEFKPESIGGKLPDDAFYAFR